jgi:hypothetical protein
MITAEKVLNDEACQEHVFKNEWCVSKRSALKAMGEYLRLKVAESESKNLKQAYVIKSVCESFVVRHNYKQDATCERCGKFPWEHSQTVL